MEDNLAKDNMSAFWPATLALKLHVQQWGKNVPNIINFSIICNSKSGNLFIGDAEQSAAQWYNEY